jgi:hypothetical protein
MSALERISDSRRTRREVRKVPDSDIAHLVWNERPPTEAGLLTSSPSAQKLHLHMAMIMIALAVPDHLVGADE